MKLFKLETCYKTIYSHVQEEQKRSLSENPSSLQNTKESIISKIELLDLQDQNKQRLMAEFFGLGPIKELTENLNITEIMINDYQSIWYEENGHIHHHSDCFFSQSSYKNFIDRFCQENDIQFSLNTPHSNGSFGSYRVHLMAPPLTHNSISLTLRRHPKAPWTLQRLQEEEWASEQQVQYLKQILLAKKNILVIGATGSGKTSTLNALLQDIGNQERAIIIEDTDELNCPNELSLKLITRESLNTNLQSYELQDLIKQSLRMRPQRLVIGEVRGPEAKDLLMALATGHKGSLCSLHANHPQQALLRLEMLIQLGAPHWSTEAIRRLILLSLDKIICVEQNKSIRKLSGIHKISSLERNGLVTEKIY